MTTELATLLDEVLPQYDVSAKYSIRINASAEKIYDILRKGIPSGAITKILMVLRNLPRIVQRQKRPDAEDAFYRLRQLKDREIVIGIVGQFWKRIANTIPIQSLEEFLAFEKDGYSKAALNLRIIPLNSAECRVVTETRVLSYGRAKDDFKHYWHVIRPFSGIIRREVLRKIKKKAEKS